MVTIKDIYSRLDIWAPFQTQMDFDNSGHLVGWGRQPVTRVLVSLDVTRQVVEEASTLGAEVIVSHHPVLFEPLRHLTDDTAQGALLLQLAENRIGVISAHTNLDAAQGGVNDALAKALKLSDIQQLHQDGTDGQGRPYGIGRIGLAHEPGLSMQAYTAFVKAQLSSGDIRYLDSGRPVRRVAVGGGACGSMLEDVVSKGCDTFITADVKYHCFLEAQALGLNLMDAGHFSTENVVCPEIVRFLSEAFPELSVCRSKVHHEVYRQA